MFPLRDENPALHRSVATFPIILANAAVWLFVQKLGTNPGLVESVCKYGLIPGELLSRINAGTRIPISDEYVCVIGNTPHFLTVITHMFMHGGWFHILGNMWFLSIFGDNVEDAMGSIRFIFFYLLCGLASATAQTLADPSSVIPMVGASGAIGGVMGAYAVLYPRAPVHMLVFLGFFVTRIVVPAFFMLGYWFFLQFIEGMLTSGGSSKGGVAFWAHVGGFVAGIVLVRLFCNPKRLAQCRSRRGRFSGMFGRVR